LVPIFNAVTVGTKKDDMMKETTKKGSIFGFEDKDKTSGESIIRSY
jgi:hypothetical protein